ncbi:hypothetical protein AAFC00_004529 [Neodothiora populina]|uniref:WSC domain-containing protein n=1 Tax=Neodothiora populina TaxID=2781224 RepID=A0ABR3P2H8_9PEZI
MHFSQILALGIASGGVLVAAQAPNGPTSCASDNTAAGSYKAKTSPFMTTGLCQAQCDSYAYGVVQSNSCWCTNDAASSPKDNSDCDLPCPGYPTANCGSDSKGLFTYIKLGGSNATSTGSETPSSSSSLSSSSASAPFATSGSDNSTSTSGGSSTGNGTSTSGGHSGSGSGSNGTFSGSSPSAKPSGSTSGAASIRGAGMGAALLAVAFGSFFL